MPAAAAPAASAPRPAPRSPRRLADAQRSRNASADTSSRRDARAAARDMPCSAATQLRQVRAPGRVQRHRRRTHPPTCPARHRDARSAERILHPLRSSRSMFSGSSSGSVRTATSPPTGFAPRSASTPHAATALPSVLAPFEAAVARGFTSPIAPFTYTAIATGRLLRSMSTAYAAPVARDFGVRGADRRRMAGVVRRASPIGAPSAVREPQHASASSSVSGQSRRFRVTPCSAVVAADAARSHRLLRLPDRARRADAPRACDT